MEVQNIAKKSHQSLDVDLPTILKEFKFGTVTERR